MKRTAHVRSRPVHAVRRCTALCGSGVHAVIEGSDRTRAFAALLPVADDFDYRKENKKGYRAASYTYQGPMRNDTEYRTRIGWIL
eukprot:6180442-Pleurochrysis_carterae.AAC.1